MLPKWQNFANSGHQSIFALGRPEQCDQTLKLNAAQIYSKVDPKQSYSSVYFKVMSFYKAQKVTIYLGYFCKKICYQELSEIAQSGSTDPELTERHWRSESVCPSIFVRLYVLGRFLGRF